MGFESETFEELPKEPHEEAPAEKLLDTLERIDVEPDEERLAQEIASEWREVEEVVNKTRPDAPAGLRKALLVGMAAASLFAAAPKPETEAGEYRGGYRPGVVMAEAERRAGAYGYYGYTGQAERRKAQESIRRGRGIVQSTQGVLGEVQRAPQNIRRGGGLWGVFRSADGILRRIESLERATRR